MEPLVSENQIFIKLYLSLTRFDSFYFYSCSNDHITVLMLSCYFSNTLSVVAKRQCYSSVDVVPGFDVADVVVAKVPCIGVFVEVVPG